eukprot:TRINITY_DN46511_c0_g1_i1.p1 TRINITY_DN46511_c0_g1~~TRINITY_DN46511_c0_g1_i1.p1  ORF type:complete len:979 (-),score=147.61 TRINITY_DN46511_c0_g1_i1:12-2948(-)
MRATVPLPAHRASVQRNLRALHSPVPPLATQAVRTAQQAQATITERRGDDKEAVTSPRPVQPTSSWPSLRTLDVLANAGGCPGARYGHCHSAAAPPVCSSLSAPIASSPRPASVHVLPGPRGSAPLACAAAAYPHAKLGSCSACPGTPITSQVHLTGATAASTIQPQPPQPLRPQPNHEWRWAQSSSGEVYMADLPAELVLTRNSSAPDLEAPYQEDHVTPDPGQRVFSGRDASLQQVPGRPFPIPRNEVSLSPRQVDQNVLQTNHPQPLQKQSQALDQSRKVDSPKRQNWQHQLARSQFACKPCSRKETASRMPSRMPATTTCPRGSRQAAPAANGSIAKSNAPTASACLSQQPAPPSGRSSQAPLSWASDDWITAGGMRSPRDDRSSSVLVAMRSGGHLGTDMHEATRTGIQLGDDVAGMRESGAMALQQVKQELEQLRYENALLQDKLAKARGLHSQAQRQAEETQSELDRERLRSESLKKSSQQLLRQLKRETARVLELEQQLPATGRSEARRDGASVHPDPHLDVFANGGSGLETSVSSTLDLGECPGGNGEPLLHNDEVLQHASALELKSRSDGTLQLDPGCAAEGCSQAAQYIDSPGQRPEPLRTATALPESGISGSEVHGSSDEVQKSWEFVVQGQHDSELLQQDFAPKLVSCYPDDAVQKALTCGVACVCTRGRRLDRSVPNQDDFVAARHTLAHGGHVALYGVFDGHGPAGHHCAAFARGAIPESLFGQRTLLLRPEDTLREAFRQTQLNLLKQDFDTAHSGTTACLALVLNLPASQSDGAQIGEAWLFVAHVGDSRAILASRRGSETAAFTVTALTKDHRPDEPEESERVRRHGGEIRKLRENSGAARVFMKGRDRPALALTRTLGASAASECGVTAEPDVSAYRLRPGVDVLLVLGTDGLFEFCSNDNAAAQILKEGVTDAVVSSLCRASRRQWAQGSYNETVDDITEVAAVLPPGVPNLDKWLLC